MSSTSRSTCHVALLATTVMLIVSLCTASTLAADRETLYNASYSFSAADFSDVDTQLTGIFITEVPSATIGTLCYGNRVIQAGDALPASALDALTLDPTCKSDREAVMGYLPVTSSGIGAPQTLTVSILSGKNDAPVAKDGKLETYKNIANTGTLEVTDAEGDKLQFDLTSAPKRGTVELNSDGTYTYTPNKNKVGKDSFNFTVTDAAGNVSNEATIKIEILKPVDKLTYSDMTGDPDHFAALWLHNKDIFSGESVADTTCFNPNKTVSRGEFLVMISSMIGLKPDDAEMTSGFSDESSTPQWMRPYIVSALRAGMISGVNSDDGLVFRPDANLTNAEAAVMLQNILQLPETKEASGFPEDSTVPAWAETAVDALSGAGIPVDYQNCTDSVTRREAARMLYAAHQLRTNSADSGLF